MKRIIPIVLLCLCAATVSQDATSDDFVVEPARQTEVIYDADVVVIGGGITGFGAAIGSARAGAKTVVIERTGYLGGWLRGTALGMQIWASGQRPTIREGAIVDIARKMVELKAAGYTNLETVLEQGRLFIPNHETIAQAFQQLVLEAGAKILYFSTYTDSIIKDGKIDAVVIVTPSGRYAVRGKVFVDCTGLATVAAESGAPVKKKEAFMGLLSWMGGVDGKRYSEWLNTRPRKGTPELRKWVEEQIGEKITYFSVRSPSPEMNDYPWDDWWDRNSGYYGEFIREAVERGELPLFYKVGDKGTVSIIEGLKTLELETFGSIARPRSYIVGVDPTDVLQVSEAHAKSTQMLFQYVQFLNKYIPGFEKAKIIRLAEMTMNRAGRSIRADEEPTRDDIEVETQFDDAICLIQRGKNKGIYEVPYRALLPRNTDNLLAAGKSASGGISFRSPLVSVILGQAAGTAAAMAAEADLLPSKIDIRKLQDKLRAAGIEVPQKP